MVLEDFEKNLISCGLLKGRDDGKVLLGISGGVDSMVMLDLFVKAGVKAGVAHCNFGLRGNDSDMDELLVQRCAEESGLEFFSVRFDTKEVMARSGESVQMAARRLRYDWFEKLCSVFGYTWIAIAHQADDTIETFFINLLRGTGIRGLTGIPQTNRNIIRPLLNFSRAEIAAYAVENAVEYRNDVSNAETNYVRNNLRHNVLPRLKEIAPNFGETMLENIGRLMQVQTFVAGRLKQIRREIVDEDGEKTEIMVDRLKGCASFAFVLYELMREWGFNNEVVNDLCTCIEKGYVGRRFFSPTHMALLDRGTVMVVKHGQQQPAGDSAQLGSSRGSVVFHGKRITAEMVYPYQVTSFEAPSHVAYFDLESVSFPLNIRVWKPGDYFFPLGMTGRKKISDFLVDSKVSRLDKEQQLVVTDNRSELVWVVGRRIDDRFKITLLTNRILKLTVEEVSGNDSNN